MEIARLSDDSLREAVAAAKLRYDQLDRGQAKDEAWTLYLNLIAEQMDRKKRKAA